VTPSPSSSWRQDLGKGKDAISASSVAVYILTFVRPPENILDSVPNRLQAITSKVHNSFARLFN